jgi:ankyrin repeat protein
VRRAAAIAVPLLLIAWLAAAVVQDRRHARLAASLVRAVNQRDVARVEALLRQGADPNARDWATYYRGPEPPFCPPWYEKPLARLMRRRPRPASRYVGPTVLMIAAHHGDTAIARSLLGRGADMGKKGSHTEGLNDGIVVDALGEAVMAGNVATALLLIQRGTSATVNAKEDGNTTPLMLVNNAEIAAALIRKGADVDAVDRSGNTPLLMAAGSTIPPDVARLLLHSGADANVKNWTGQTPLMQACLELRPEVVKLLLARGADVNLRDRNGNTALMNTTFMRLPELPGDELKWKQKRRQVQKLLIDGGADPGLRDNDGMTAADYEKEF